MAVEAALHDGAASTSDEEDKASASPPSVWDQRPTDIACWGRYPTITTFGMLYLVGDGLLAVAAHPSVLAHRNVAEGIFIFGLFGCIGLGTGAIKSNVITLGADQFNPTDASETHQKATFFSYFYWCINFGAAFAYGYLASLSVNGSSIVPADLGYFACFAICTCVMALALLCLRLGRARYIQVPPSSDAMSQLVRVLWQRRTRNVAASRIVWGFGLFLLSFGLNIVAAVSVSGRVVLSLLAGVASSVAIVCWVVYGQRQIGDDDDDNVTHDNVIVDNVSVKTSSSAREDTDAVQKVVRILPFAAFTIVWGCVSDQIDANFQSITQQCDLRLTATTQVPGAMLGIFDPLAIIVLIPVLESGVYPLYERIALSPPTAFGKTSAGLALAAFWMFYVGLFEIVRRRSGPVDGNVRDAGSGSPMNNLHWAWNVPQYVGVALCECLINVTAYDIFYTEVPLHLKSTAQAINLFTVSMGSNFTSIFTLAFGQYIPNDLNVGHVEYMFFAVGTLALVNVAAYIVVMRRMQFGMSASGYGLVAASDDGTEERTITVSDISSDADRDTACSSDDDHPHSSFDIHLFGSDRRDGMTREKKRHPVVFVLIDGIGDMTIDISKYRSARGTPGTTLQAAHTPAMDAIARAGLNGLLDPVEPGMACGSDTAHMSIFGYPPTKHYRGRGSFEAMGAGLEMAPGDVAFKCNFAHLDRASNIVTMRRVDRNFHSWGTDLCPFIGSFALPSFPNVRVACKYATEHRCGIVFHGPNLSDQITGTDPLKDELPLLKSTPIDPALPSAVYTSQVLNEASAVIIDRLSRHPLNVAREAEGLATANLVLFRGPGERINVPNFEATHGMKSFMIAPTCIIAGLGKSLDMDVIPVEGATGDYHTNLLNKANAALDCFRDRTYDFGFVHVKAVDDAGHDRDVHMKVSTQS
ncbi:hypothetical protein DYB35_002533 [Aphanomyces astaci]|uniref:Metalloenzyme domain-containing protein n=2 Tax=Aphanomyces astaci TaxID=112090 RepID=A0A3R7E416_APHAT|nr:hypothetical protein DYB35_002533 [Aphanomyces astaci]